MWDRLNFRQKHMDSMKFMHFYRHKAYSIFLLPNFFFHPKFEFYLKCTLRRLVHHKLFLWNFLITHHPYPETASRKYYILPGICIQIKRKNKENNTLESIKVEGLNMKRRDEIYQITKYAETQHHTLYPNFRKLWRR